MWPPHSVKTWPTPACLRTRATSCPPVRSATEHGDDLGGEALDLLPLGGGGADRIQDDVVAARGAVVLELLGALLRRADDAVLARQRLEGLCVALRGRLGPHGFGGFPVAAHRDERQVRGREAFELATRCGGRGANLLEALRVTLGLHDVGHPPVALATGPHEGRLRAAADPDRRSRLLHG